MIYIKGASKKNYQISIMIVHDKNAFTLTFEMLMNQQPKSDMNEKQPLSGMSV